VNRTRALYLVAPLPAIGVGTVVAVHHGVSWSAYLPNIASLVAGISLVTWVWRARIDAPGAKAVATTAFGILATLAFPGIDGVNRWVYLGPVRLNASAAFSPWLLLGLSARSPRVRALASAGIVIVQLGHVLQPDAGQATALAAGAVPLLLTRPDVASRWALGFTLVTLAAAAWLRVDPLVPVGHVEGIVSLAWSMGAVHVGLVVVSVSFLLIPFVAIRGWAARDGGTWAALSYLVAAFVVTVPGHFPVPVVGAGAGPVLGWYGLLILSSRGAADGAVSP
jgi:hypothetical protein